MSAFKNTSKYFLFVILFFLLVPAENTLAIWKVSAAGACQLPNADPDAVGFYDAIRCRKNWRGSFYLLFGMAKERHYKLRWLQDGFEHQWVDSSDIHYHVSHGIAQQDPGNNNLWLTAVIFQNGDALIPSEALGAWGNDNLEWIGFRNCNLLNNASWSFWAQAMNGLHLFLGFRTGSKVANNFGSLWAQNMFRIIMWIPGVGPGKGFIIIIPGKTVAQAFFRAVDATQPKGIIARVIGENIWCFRDCLWGEGFVLMPDPIPNQQKVIVDHKAGSPDYLFVNTLPAMIIYEVIPRNVDEAYVRNVGQAFGMGTEVPVVEPECCASGTYVMCYLDDPNVPDSNFYNLEVYKETGQYYYMDNTLWDVDPCDPFVPLPSESEAHTAAETFLTMFPQLRQSDAGTYDVETDELVIVYDINDPQGPNDLYPQNRAVIYDRHIEGYTGTLVSVAGPGARQKIYVGQGGKIIGAMGNWRQIQQTPPVPVMTNIDTLNLYQTYKERVSIAPIYLEYDSVDANLATATQAYYEFSGTEYQSKLIPVWIFEAEYFKDSNSIATAYAYIPSVKSFCRPIATIDSPTEAAAYNEGQTISFQASVDPNFGIGPYTFQWKSDVDGPLSTAQNFDSNSLSVNCDEDCNVMSHAITVTVKDSEGLQSIEGVNITVQGTCTECPTPADMILDGIVDMKDLAKFASYWLKESSLGE